MENKILEKLYRMWLFREEAKNGTKIYTIRTARLNGAIDLVKAMGYDVQFNPLAEKENPFSIKLK